MRSHPAITPLLVKSGAYRDLEHPVILARGDLGIYFVQAEKLCRDDPSFIEKYAADPVGMIAHAAGLMEQHPEFKMVIDTLAETVQHWTPSHNSFQDSQNLQIKDNDPAYTVIPPFNLQIFPKLCAILTKFNSIFVPCKPLSRNSLNPRFCLMFPITGSTVHFLRR